jgi:hypothetical protein
VTGIRPSTLALGGFALLAFGTPASAQSSAGEWRQTVFPLGMGATIDGDSQIGPLQVPVDVGMSLGSATGPRSSTNGARR